MASETMSAIMAITVCFFLVCNATNVTTEVTTTPDHSETVFNTEKSLDNSTETTGSPALDVINTTISNTNTTKLNASEPSQSSQSTAAATTQSTVNVSGSSTSKATATSTSLSSSTAPLSGPSTTSNNQTYNTTKSAVSVTRVLSTPATQAKPTPQSNGTKTTPNSNATTGLSEKEKHSMNYPEIILTSIFSTILVVVVLVISSVVFKRCLRGRSQYSHHPLHEAAYESDRYSPPDDTLVISGGLYDAPRIYNPNMTVLEDEEAQNDYASFNSRSGQFKLEFLPGDKDMDPVLNRSQRRNV